MMANLLAMESSGTEYPLNLYYAYGVKNSFGIGFDPISGELWDTENGPQFGDDSLNGGRGNDNLFGDPGNDYLSVGPGIDYFDYGPGKDRVLDFNLTEGDTKNQNCEY